MKIFCIFCLLVFVTLPLSVAGQDQSTTSGSPESARIIIKLNVPRIDELTAASNRFCSPDPEKGGVWGGLNADMALADSIAYAAQGVLSELHGTPYEVNRIYKSIPYMALQVSTEGLALLQASPAVLGIEEDVPMRLIDPVLDGGGAKGDRSASIAGDLNPPLLDTSVNLIGANTAWSMGFTGSGWYVAVLDTGIRSTHQFFQGKTIIEACYALGSDGVGPVGDCPNLLISMTGSGSAVHYPSTYSGYDHGTHVSGIATGNNGVLFGVAKNANIIAVKIFSKFPDTYSSCGGTPCVLTWTSDQVAGLDYVYSIRGSYSIASVNMSIGGGSYSSPCDSASQKISIDNLRAVGIATAIATGNNAYCGSIGSPACISTSVAVGSSTKADAESPFNNWHATMQRVFAPGSSINSSTGVSDSSFASWNGTSMATPHVAGAWALLKQAKPAGTVSEFLTALQSTGVGITAACTGATPLPRIQVNAAISSILPLRITAPNGGESWPLGGTRAITWVSSITANVKLVLFKNGIKVGNIVTDIPASGGTYSWTVGNYIGGIAAAGTGYTVRVIDMSGQYSDYSDASFSLFGVTLTSPNGGQTWKSGATMPVTWSSSGVSANVKLVLFKDGVKVGNIVTDLPVSGGTYSWTVGDNTVETAAVGTGYKIRVITMDGVYKDDSDAAFTISGLTLTAPNGGESWTLGGTRSVTWISAGGVTGNLKLVLFKAGIKVGNIVSDIPASGGTYSWTVGNYIGGTATIGTGYKIRVITMDGQYSDYGNNTFVIQ